MTAASSARVGTFKVGSVLLQYPTRAIFRGLDELEQAVGNVSQRSSREPLQRFVGWLRETGPTEVAQHYVATFDLRRRCALYLTYYRYGDTRKRGMAMLAFKQAYRKADFAPTEDELPDYLPLVLEFAALSDEGAKLLRSRRADLEMLRRALHDAGTPYAEVVDAVCARLPGLKRRDIALVRDQLAAGPPHEDVGLEPFAPPEYVSGQEGRR